MKKVFIGVGHGGADSGAVAHDGQFEKDLNLSIAHACGMCLIRHNVKVKFSRTLDEADPVSQEVAECNSFAPDLAVDIHNNAGGGDGAEVFHSKVGGTGKTLAKNILNEIVVLNQESRGVKTRLNSKGLDYYAFIRNTKAPAVIVECAFVDSADLAIIDTEPERELMGIAIAKGILKTLGLEYFEESPMYKVQVGAFRNKANAEKLLEDLKSKGYKGFIVEAQQ